MDKKNLDEFVQKIEDNANETLEDTLLDEDASSEDTRGLKYEDIALNTTKDKMSKLPWLMGMFLIIIISIVFGFMFLNGNPQTIFTMAIDNFFSSITGSISDNVYDISKGKINANFNISSNDEYADTYKNISKTSFNIDYSIDNANDLSHIKVQPVYNGDKQTSMDIYNNKNSIYVYSKDLYENYIKLDKTRPFKIIGSKDIKNILNGLNQAFDKVATSEKVSGSKNNFDAGNKTIKVYETKLIIGDNNYERVSETFINTLKSNDEFVGSLSKLMNTSNSKVKAYLDELIPKLEEAFKENETLEVKLYIDKKSHNFIKGEMSGKRNYLSILNKDGSYEFNIKDLKKKVNNSGKIDLDVNKDRSKYDLNINFKLEKDDGVTNGDVKIAYTNKKASSFDKPDVKKAVKESDLSELERISIYSKIFTNPSLNSFLKFLK